jgi:hypothetical protein
VLRRREEHPHSLRSPICDRIVGGLRVPWHDVGTWCVICFLNLALPAFADVSSPPFSSLPFPSPLYTTLLSILSNLHRAGSWYNKHELGKRIVFFQGRLGLVFLVWSMFADSFAFLSATSAIGTMFSGFLQAAVHKGLNGAHGIPGYKWLFLMDGVVCMPIAVAGYFLGRPLHSSLPHNTDH